MTDERQQCQIQKTVKLFCPNCGALVEVPMCQAVNGKPILCNNCSKEFIFRDQLVQNY